jgi:hypothetical protein
MLSDRGSSDIPVEFRDSSTKELLESDVSLGRGSVLYPLFDAGGSYSGKAVKQYLKPLALFVKTLVEPKAVSAAQFDVTIDDD